MAVAYKPLDADVPEGHAFQEHGTRYAADMRLRKNGFIIVSRPRRGPTIWTRKGERYTQEAALSLCLK